MIKRIIKIFLWIHQFWSFLVLVVFVNIFQNSLSTSIIVIWTISPEMSYFCGIVACKIIKNTRRWLLRSLGAFFIKRRMEPSKGKKDVLYRALLHTYMMQCLGAGHNFEFFIEGGRTRTGKPCMPKGTPGRS